MSNIHVVSASLQNGRQKISISISLAIILVAIELLIALLFTRTHFGFIPVLKAIFMGSNSRTCKNLELKKKNVSSFLKSQAQNTADVPSSLWGGEGLTN